MVVEPNLSPHNFPHNFPSQLSGASPGHIRSPALPKMHEAVQHTTPQCKHMSPASLPRKQTAMSLNEPRDFKTPSSRNLPLQVSLGRNPSNT